MRRKKLLFTVLTVMLLGIISAVRAESYFRIDSVEKRESGYFISASHREEYVGAGGTEDLFTLEFDGQVLDSHTDRNAMYDTEEYASHWIESKQYGTVYYWIDTAEFTLPLTAEPGIYTVRLTETTRSVFGGGEPRERTAEFIIREDGSIEIPADEPEEIPESNTADRPKAIPLPRAESVPWEDEYFAFQSGKQWGLINTRGETVLSPCFDFLKPAGSSVFIIEEGSHYGLLDRTTVVLDPEYDEAESLGDGVFLFRRNNPQGKPYLQFLANLDDGMMYDISGEDYAWSPDHRHVLLENLEENSARFICDAHGNLISLPWNEVYVDFFEDTRIGVSYMKPGDTTLYSVLLNADGTVSMREEADSAWWGMATKVPIRSITTSLGEKQWEVCFTNAVYFAENRDLFYGAMEGWWTEDGTFYTCEEAMKAGITKDPTAAHIGVCYEKIESPESRSIRINSVFPAFTGHSPHWTHIRTVKRPLPTSGGYTVMYTEGGIPYYADVELFRHAAAGLESSNNMITFLNRLEQKSPLKFQSIRDIALSAVSKDGIGIGELLDADSRHYFFWMRMNHWKNGSDVHMLDESDLHADIVNMSYFSDGTSIVYSSDGKQGLIDENGKILLDVSWQVIYRYGRYIVAVRSDSPGSPDAADSEFAPGVSASYAPDLGLGVYETDLSIPDKRVREGHSWLLDIETQSLIPCE